MFLHQTGSYHVPTRTITGDLEKELLVIDKVIGAKTCISDHRSSEPSLHELAKMATECRVGGMISSKAGKVHVHVGRGKKRIFPLFELLKETEV